MSMPSALFSILFWVAKECLMFVFLITSYSWSSPALFYSERTSWIFSVFKRGFVSKNGQGTPQAGPWAKCPVLGVGLCERVFVCGVRQTVMRDDGAFGSLAIFWLLLDKSLQYYISFCSELNFAPKKQLRNIQFLQVTKLWAFFHFLEYCVFYCVKLGAVWSIY